MSIELEYNLHIIILIIPELVAPTRLMIILLVRMIIISIKYTGGNLNFVAFT